MLPNPFPKSVMAWIDLVNLTQLKLFGPRVATRKYKGSRIETSSLKSQPSRCCSGRWSLVLIPGDVSMVVLYSIILSKYSYSSTTLSSTVQFVVVVFVEVVATPFLSTTVSVVVDEDDW